MNVVTGGENEPSALTFTVYVAAGRAAAIESAIAATTNIRLCMVGCRDGRRYVLFTTRDDGLSLGVIVIRLPHS